MGQLTTGEAMQRARLRSGLTQRELAKAAGIAHTSVHNYEQDHTSPSLYNVIELADVLGISIDEYIGHRIKERKTADELS